ncbi:MAG: DJ-1/PfpI family protein [Desulfuromonadaceae bacterium]|nr:DJ-1/PfpI family protein [Desulfuromonadaceae bacterium]
MTKKALLILTDGFEEVEAITPVDLLRRAGIDLVTAGLKKDWVQGRQGVTVKADTVLNRVIGLFDALILPGGPGHKALMESDKVLKLTRDYFRDGILCCAICAAPKVFAAAGILDGKRFTCYPGSLDDFSLGEYVEKEVVRDGHIITSAGPGTAVPFSLAIVEALLGEAKSSEVKGQILFRE